MGAFESSLYELLASAGYTGLMVCDDIELNRPMRKFWRFPLSDALGFFIMIHACAQLTTELFLDVMVTF